MQYFILRCKGTTKIAHTQEIERFFLHMSPKSSTFAPKPGAKAKNSPKDK